MYAAMNQLLTNRQRSLGIRSIKFTVVRHFKRDAGCRVHAAERLNSHRHGYDYALVMFDRDGCGAEDRSRVTIQREVEQELHNSGWQDRSKVIVIDPELEAWVWTESPHTARILGWGEGYSELQTWLNQRDLWPADDLKPPDPNEAFRRALMVKGLQMSPKRFERLAKVVGLKGCQDPAFAELKATLAGWFSHTRPVSSVIVQAGSSSARTARSGNFKFREFATRLHSFGSVRSAQTSIHFPRLGVRPVCVCLAALPHLNQSLQDGGIDQMDDLAALEHDALAFEHVPDHGAFVCLPILIDYVASDFILDALGLAGSPRTVLDAVLALR